MYWFVGQFDKGVGLVRAAGKLLKVTLKGEKLVGKVGTVLKVFKVAGKFLSILGLALDAFTLIYEAVDGADQRKTLQK